MGKRKIDPSIWVYAKEGKDAEIILVMPNGLTYRKPIGNATQTQADHLACQEALKLAMHEEGRTKIYTESNVIIGQLIKRWNIKSNKKMANKTRQIYNNMKNKVYILGTSKEKNKARHIAL
jgi:ribonuclease HI